MKKFDAEKIFFYKIGSFVNLDNFPSYIELADSLENLLFAYFYGLCVLIEHMHEGVWFTKTYY